MKYRITLKRLKHRNKRQIGIYFSKNRELIKVCKSIEARFSATHSCWYLENNRENLNAIFEAFKGKAWVDTTPFYNKENQTIISREKILVNLSPAGKKELHYFIKELEARGLSENTIRSYGSAIAIFLTYFRGQSLQELKNDDINKFLGDYLYEQHYSRSYQSQFISAIKRFLLSRTDISVELEQMIHPPKERNLPKTFSKKEVKRMIDTIHNLKHKTLISLQYGGGLRVGELIGIRMHDVDLERSILIVRGKGRKSRRIFIGRNLNKLLTEYLKVYQPKSYLFEGAYGSYSMTSVNAILKRAAESAGIKRPVYSHMLRHSYATHLLESGVDLRYIQELLGHSSSRTTEIYTYVSKKKLGDIESPFENLDDDE